MFILHGVRWVKSLLWYISKKPYPWKIQVIFHKVWFAKGFHSAYDPGEPCANRSSWDVTCVFPGHGCLPQNRVYVSWLSNYFCFGNNSGDPAGQGSCSTLWRDNCIQEVQKQKFPALFLYIARPQPCNLGQERGKFVILEMQYGKHWNSSSGSGRPLVW